MEFLWNKITEWLKDVLVSGIMGNLNGLFDGVNGKVAEIAGTVGTTPQGWNGGVFNMIKSISENVIVPIAGIILTFIMTYELIQMVIDKNSFHDFETFMFFKWVFKTFAAVCASADAINRHQSVDAVIKAAAVDFFCNSDGIVAVGYDRDYIIFFELTDNRCDRHLNEYPFILHTAGNINKQSQILADFFVCLFSLEA